MSSPSDHVLSEGCGNSGGTPRTVWLNAAALTKLDSLFIPISFPAHPSHSATGLVDSSSTHCFIDTRFANKLGLSPYNIHPLRLRLLGGSFSSQITHAVDLTICHSTGDVIGVTFYVTQLDPPVVLVFEYNWLYRYNPLIDWYSSQILSFQTLLQKVSKPTPIGLQLPELQPTDFLLPQLESPLTDLLLPEPQITDSAPPWFESPLSSPVPPEVEQSKPSVSFIIAAAYTCAAHVEGSVSFQLSLSDPSLYGRSASTAPAKPDLTGILEEYHEFVDVFSQAEADTLPTHCPYDLKIDLEEGAEPPLSKSAHSMPILFIKKKDSSLHLCIDFHGLNCIMKKDRYLLPLISDLLDASGRACIYTKIDL